MVITHRLCSCGLMSDCAHESEVVYALRNKNKNHTSQQKQISALTSSQSCCLLCICFYSQVSVNLLLRYYFCSLLYEHIKHMHTLLSPPSFISQTLCVSLFYTSVSYNHFTSVLLELLPSPLHTVIINKHVSYINNM